MLQLISISSAAQTNGSKCKASMTFVKQTCIVINFSHVLWSIHVIFKEIVTFLTKTICASDIAKSLNTLM